MILTTDNVRDPHVVIVHHDAKIVRRRAVRACDNEVVELLVLEHDRPFDKVTKRGFSGLRCAETNRERTVGLVAPIAAGAVVNGLASGFLRRLPLSVELFRCAVATISLAATEQFLDPGSMELDSVRLEEGPLVPVDAEPAEPVEDRLDRFGSGALTVGVLDPENELSPMTAREEVAEKRRAGAADVEIPRGAGCETTADFRHERSKLTTAPHGVNATFGGSSARLHAWIASNQVATSQNPSPAAAGLADRKFERSKEYVGICRSFVSGPMGALPA